MDRWNKATLKSAFVPGGILLLLAAVLLQGGFPPVAAQAINYYYYAVFAAGILLSWRFHSSRVLLPLLALLLAHRAIEFFPSGRSLASGPGRTAFEAVAVLLPLNYLIFAMARERGLTMPAVAPRLGLLFLESTFVAILCRPGTTASPVFLHFALLDRHLFHWTRIPQLALLAFGVTFTGLAIRFVLYGKPTDSGLLWSLAAALAGWQAGGAGRLGNAYFATAGLILVASLIENSYALAYQDELTGLPARRAFNEALLRLQAPYAVAVVDIDHFKAFNDTYGHDTGDQVLQMVAARLTRVTGGGQAYRVGGEEFSILFPGRSLKQVLPHLETLRVIIAESTFRVRCVPERRQVSRGPDRRAQQKNRTIRRRAVDPRQARLRFATNELSVTVSIGVAEPAARMPDVEQVIQAADRALYRAKETGRNRVETSTVRRARTSRLKSSIA